VRRATAATANDISTTWSSHKLNKMAMEATDIFWDFANPKGSAGIAG